MGDGDRDRLLHAVFAQAPSLIAVLRGPEHVVALANPAFCKVVGRTESDVVGKPLREVAPDFVGGPFADALDAVYRTGEAFVASEMTIRFDRGHHLTETMIFDFQYAAVRDADGVIEGVSFSATDVTSQSESREQISALRDEAESANRAKDEFLAMLGHELRNPLSPILTALQVMKLRGEAGSARERTVIERQVNHLTRLVDDLLDVSRIARGRVELKTELVELSEVVAKAIEMASPLLEQRAHQLEVDVARTGLLVDGDPIRLGQIVSNLMTNAAKYTPPGGRITVHAVRSGDDVELSVRDTGIGIAPEMLPRIFELFVQERQALDRSQGGLGIGLTIVRSLVTRHGGTVNVTSEGLGKGSHFLVTLPLSSRDRDTAELAPLERPHAPTAVMTARILVVDDNEDGAEMLAAALESKGYVTRVAHDAPTALRIAVEFHPQIALLDIGLPVMDGYELASHLRDLPGMADLRLVALTGYGQESDRQRTRDAGFHDHLVKPVDLGAIMATLGASGLPAETDR
jgi:signal transduction histidine kinase/ActR/RegA family two-component response regulator